MKMNIVTKNKTTARERAWKKYQAALRAVASEEDNLAWWRNDPTATPDLLSRLEADVAKARIALARAEAQI